MRLWVRRSAPPREMLATFISDPAFEWMLLIEGISATGKRGHCLVPGPEKSLIFAVKFPADPVWFSIRLGYRLLIQYEPRITLKRVTGVTLDLMPPGWQAMLEVEIRSTASLIKRFRRSLLATQP